MDIEQGMAGEVIEAGGREVASLLHVSSENVECGVREVSIQHFIRVAYLAKLSTANIYTVCEGQPFVAVK